jgi:hypothetical protein
LQWHLSLDPETDSVGSSINSLRFLWLPLLNGLVQISMGSDKRRKNLISYLRVAVTLIRLIFCPITSFHTPPRTRKLPIRTAWACKPATSSRDPGPNQSIHVNSCSSMAVQCRCEMNARWRPTILCGRQNLSGRCVNDMSLVVDLLVL